MCMSQVLPNFILYRGSCIYYHSQETEWFQHKDPLGLPYNNHIHLLPALLSSLNPGNNLFPISKTVLSQKCEVSRITQYLTFKGLAFPPPPQISSILCRYIQVDTRINNSFLCTVNCYSMAWMCHSLPMHLLKDIWANSNCLWTFVYVSSFVWDKCPEVQLLGHTIVALRFLKK